jgi:hypothetical protein
MRNCERLLAAVVCLVLVGVVSGCGGKVDLGFRLPEGTTKTLKSSHDLTTTTEVMGQNMDEKQQGTNTLQFTVESVDEQGVTTATLKTDMAGTMLEAMSAAMPDETFEEMKNATLTVTIGPKGDVRTVTGMEPVVEKLVEGAKKAMDAQMADVPPQMKAMAASQMSQMMEGMTDAVRTMAGDEAAQKNLNALLGFYPAEPVGVDDTWSRTYEVMMPAPMQATAEYVVKARSGGVMSIDFKTTYAPMPDKAIDLGIMSMEFLMRGTETGSMQVDEETGWIIAVSSTVDVKGSIDMGMMESKVAIKGTEYIDGG